MIIVVVGFGSIGKRHVKNLLQLGPHDIILYREQGKGNELDLPEIYNLSEITDASPDFVLISNPSSKHYDFISFCLKNDLNFLCEKPLVATEDQLVKTRQLTHSYSKTAKVVFNMRYHPCIIKIQEILDGKVLGHINYARFFVGQYLPDWRPDTNHKESYSAKRNLGGGVTLDLLHEVDLASNLICSPKQEPQAVVDRIADVTLDSEDIAEIIYQTPSKTVVSIHLDYLTRGYERRIKIYGEYGEIDCDLAESNLVLRKVGSEGTLKDQRFDFSTFQRNDMYQDLISDFIKELLDSEYYCRLPSIEESFKDLTTVFQCKKNYDESI